jgi:hypothetical protein
MTTQTGLRIALIALGLGLARPLGDDDVGSGGGVSSLVRLVFAELRDVDRSGDASRGDVVVLGLRRALAPKRVLTLDDVPVAGTHARWGDGATLTAVPGESEIRIVLGTGASLAVAGSYRPGRHGATPAQLRTATGAVPILMEAFARRAFTGERHPDATALVPYYGQLHAHTGFSDGDLTPADAYASARREGLDFFAVTDHLEQLTPESWKSAQEMAHAAEQPGAFAALCGYEWGGYPSLHGWVNHVNVLGTDERLGVWSTIGLGRLYARLAALPGAHVVAALNHPGMNHRMGRNDWDDFAYDARGDRRVRLVHVETTSDAGEDNRESAGYIPALDRGWHVAPKGEEDNHTANWGRSRRRTGLWLDRLDTPSVLAGLDRMATFYTDDRDASLKLVADREWLMGSTVYGDGPHHLEVEILHRTRVAHVTSVELVSLAGSVVARHDGGQTPLTVAWDVDPATDAYFFVRVVLESADARMISAPVFVDR